MEKKCICEINQYSKNKNLNSDNPFSCEEINKINK